MNYAEHPSKQNILQSFRHFALDIKIAHSVFALPFAVAAFIIGALPIPTTRQILLLLVCMVTARSFAMGMNRYLDRHIDGSNPRTRTRKIPAGELSANAGLGWSITAGLLFVASAFGLSPLAGYCSAPLLAILAMYSMMKHLSWLTHWYLGICLGLAPIGVAMAMTGRVDWPVIFVGIAVCLWTAGFDILYSLQDRTFDIGQRLKSVPSRFGPAGSLAISKVCFLAMIVFLSLAGWSSERGLVYFLGVITIAVLLAYEQFLVRDARVTGYSRHLNIAFFNMNAYVSVIYLVFSGLDCVSF